jgi:hypothetical protein
MSAFHNRCDAGNKAGGREDAVIGTEDSRSQPADPITAVKFPRFDDIQKVPHGANNLV